MKQINSLVASAVVSGLIVAGMVGIGVNALTTPGSSANSTAQLAASSSTNVGSNASAFLRLRQRASRERTAETGDDSIRFSL